MDEGIATFVNARPRMFAAAFRTLGDAAEAEDVVQEAWLRWQGLPRETVLNGSAFLTTTARNLAINRALSARKRYETPLELWLGEAAVDSATSPGMLAERAQALEAALRLMLEKLSAVERAAYLLREAFSCSYQHISQVIGASEANSRQLVTRARKHLAEGARGAANPTELRRISGAIADATQSGDLAGLEAILSAAILDAATSKAHSRKRCIAQRRTRAGGTANRLAPASKKRLP